MKTTDSANELTETPMVDQWCDALDDLTIENEQVEQAEIMSADESEPFIAEKPPPVWSTDGSLLRLGRDPMLHRPPPTHADTALTPLWLSMTDSQARAMLTRDSLTSQLAQYYGSAAVQGRFVPDYCKLDLNIIQMIVRLVWAELRVLGAPPVDSAAGTILLCWALTCLYRLGWALSGNVLLTCIVMMTPLTRWSNVLKNVCSAMAALRPRPVPVLRLRGGAGPEDVFERLLGSTGAQSLSSPVSQPVAAPPQNVAGSTVLPSDVRKQLLKVITMPSASSWGDLEPDKWCLAMDRYLSITDLQSDQSVVLQLVWSVLPEHVRTAVVPVDPLTALTTDSSASLWDGLDQFASWADLRAAIIAHFRPLAQRKQVALLSHLRMRPGHGRQFRHTFLGIVSKLEPAYRPSDADLLARLQMAQYPRLASMPSVIMHQGCSRWMPAQWPALLAAMTDSDTALAETAPPGGTVIPPGPGTSATLQPPLGRHKGKRPSTGNLPPPAKRTSAGQRPTGAAGPSSGGSADAGQTRAERFAGLTWADPAVERAAKAGHCINCLQPGHFAKQCPAPKVFRKKVSVGSVQASKNA